MANPITDFLEALRKRAAIRRYLKRLPRKLFQDYGHLGPYTQGQVESSLQRHRVSSSPEFLPYALAIFCDPESLERMRREHGADFETLRKEVGSTCFRGEGGVDFTTEDVARHWGQVSGHEGAGGHSGHGGDHGGDGGGGHH